MPTRMRGFTYLGLLFAVVLHGVVLSATGMLWHTQSRREKEQELLFVGQQYQQAIVAYRAAVFSGQRAYPKSLEELLEDRRFPMPVRHLRKLYRDPMTNSPKWGLVNIGDSIAGVYSLASDEPIKKANFGPCCSEFLAAKSYADWKFTSVPGAGGPTPAAVAPAAVSTPSTIKPAPSTQP